MRQESESIGAAGCTYGPEYESDEGFDLWRQSNVRARFDKLTVRYAFERKGFGDRRHSRAIVGWAMSKTLGGKLGTDALEMAIQRRGSGPKILHSDHCSNYSIARYRDLLAKHQIRRSMTRKGHWWDTPTEGFLRTLKTELVMHTAITGLGTRPGPAVRVHGDVLQPPATALDHQLRGSAGIRGDASRLITVSTVCRRDQPLPLQGPFDIGQRRVCR